MNKGKWKSNALTIAMSAVSVLVLFGAIVSTLRLPLVSKAGLLPWIVLILLTLAASRFSVAVTNADGVSQTRKSVADAFVFLAVILFAVPPADTVGPATLLAAIVGFVSTSGLASRRESILSTGIAVL